MDVKAKWVPADPEQKIRPRGEGFRESCFSGEHGSVQTARTIGGHRHQLCHVGIAADDSIEDHDVGGLYVIGESHEIALQKLDSSGVTSAFDFFDGNAQRSLRDVDVNC